MQFASEAEALIKSQWPKCYALAEQLAAHGLAAADALEKAVSSRTHHVRSAALISLNKIDPARGQGLAKRLLTDAAYEVRQNAAQILGVPTPDRPPRPGKT
jgi:HEAT repeat protein